MYKCAIIILLVILSAGKPVCALEITDDMLKGGMLSLASDVLVLHDPNSALNAETALQRLVSPNFQSDKVEPLGRQYWVYTPLINHSSSEEWVISSHNILYKKLDFYLYCPGKPLQYIPRPPLRMDSPAFSYFYQLPVTLPRNATCGFLQRVGVDVFNATPIRSYLGYPPYSIRQSNLQTLLQLTGMGAVFALILYNLLLYISVRDVNYLIYAVYAFIHFLLITFTLLPPAFIEFLGGARDALRLLSVNVIIFFTLFTLRFMQPGISAVRNNPAQKKIATLLTPLVSLNWLALSVMCLFELAFIIGSMVLPDGIMAHIIRLYSYVYIVSGLLIPLLSLVVAIGGYKPAWVFLPAWSILILSHAIFIIEFMGFIDLYGWGPILATLAAAIEMILLSMALGMNLREAYVARNRAQMARERAEVVVEQQEKFISTLSHEIRTPLHAMLGGTSLLGRTKLSTKQRDYWSTTHYAAEAMYALVDNLLDRTQLAHSQKFGSDTEFDPQRLLETMLQLLRSRAEEKNLSIRLHTRELPPRLIGRPVILRRMLINLISNAVKYTDHGEISVSADWSSRLNQLHVVVKDSGCGISAEQLAQIKTRFNMGVESLYSQNSSSGLGLAICFEMIKAAGGDLSLESQPGQGTKASFKLDMVPALPSTEQIPTNRDSDVALAILVVDDVSSNRMIARELLTAAGHAVNQAEDGEQALTLLQEQAFDVVISDVRMPRLDGVKLLEAIRQQHTPEELVVVMTSAHFDPEQREQLLLMGANACLSKPCSPDELLATVQRGSLQTTESHSPKEIFATLKGQLDDDKFAELLTIYKDQVKEDMARIIDATKQRNERNVRLSAHRIVSASRTLGLYDNAQAAQQIENHEKNQPTINWKAFNQLISRNLKAIKL